MYILSFIAAIIFDLQMLASRRIMDAGRLVAGDGINQRLEQAANIHRTRPCVKPEHVSGCNRMTIV